MSEPATKRRLVFCRECPQEFYLRFCDLKEPYGGSKSLKRHCLTTGHKGYFFPRGSWADVPVTATDHDLVA